MLLLICASLGFASAAFSQSADMLAYKADQALKRNSTDSAISLYRDALSKNPHHAGARYNLALAHKSKKEYEDAIEQFDRAAQLSSDPKIRSNSFYNAGNVLLEQGQAGPASNYYRKALKANPKSEEALQNLIYSLKRQKQQQKQEQNSDSQNDKSKEEENQENQNAGDEKNQNQNSRPGKVSEEEAKALMKYLEENEKDIQKAVHENQAAAQKSQPQGNPW